MYQALRKMYQAARPTMTQVRETFVTEGRIHQEQIALSRCGIFDSTSTGRDICPVSTGNVSNGPLGMYNWALVILLSATVMPAFEDQREWA